VSARVLILQTAYFITQMHLRAAAVCMSDLLGQSRRSGGIEDTPVPLQRHELELQEAERASRSIFASSSSPS
jgi:hypothetical protein